MTDYVRKVEERLTNMQLKTCMHWEDERERRGWVGLINVYVAGKCKGRRGERKERS